MKNKSLKFNSKSIIITSLIALTLTFLVTADKIVQLDNLGVLLAIWSIPALLLLLPVMGDLLLPKSKRKSTKIKSGDVLITSLVALIITFLITADKIAQLENLAVLIAIWSIPVLILFFNVIRDLILLKVKSKTSWVLGLIVLPLPTAILYIIRREEILLNLK